MASDDVAQPTTLFINIAWGQSKNSRNYLFPADRLITPLATLTDYLEGKYSHPWVQVKSETGDTTWLNIDKATRIDFKLQ